MAKAIIPRLKPITQKRIESAMRPVVNRVQTDIEVKFRKTTSTWKRNIRFIRDSEWVASGLDIMVWSQDIIYFWVSEGTQEHPIVPKKSPFLVFNSPFRAKTKPGMLSSGKGGRGGIINKRLIVKQKIRPRKFDVLVKQAVEKKIQDRIVKGFEDFIARTGH